MFNINWTGPLGIVALVALFMGLLMSNVPKQIADARRMDVETTRQEQLNTLELQNKQAEIEAATRERSASALHNQLMRSAETAQQTRLHEQALAANVRHAQIVDLILLALVLAAPVSLVSVMGIGAIRLLPAVAQPALVPSQTLWDSPAIQYLTKRVNQETRAKAQLKEMLECQRADLFPLRELVQNQHSEIKHLREQVADLQKLADLQHPLLSRLHSHGNGHKNELVGVALPKI
jgi:hypothetical protein